MRHSWRISDSSPIQRRSSSKRRSCVMTPPWRPCRHCDRLAARGSIHPEASQKGQCRARRWVHSPLLVVRRARTSQSSSRPIRELCPRQSNRRRPTRSHGACEGSSIARSMRQEAPPLPATSAARSALSHPSPTPFGRPWQSSNPSPRKDGPRDGNRRCAWASTSASFAAERAAGQLSSESFAWLPARIRDRSSHPPKECPKRRCWHRRHRGTRSGRSSWGICPSRSPSSRSPPGGSATSFRRSSRTTPPRSGSCGRPTVSSAGGPNLPRWERNSSAVRS